MENSVVAAMNARTVVVVKNTKTKKFWRRDMWGTTAKTEWITNLNLADLFFKRDAEDCFEEMLESKRAVLLPIEIKVKK